MKVKTNGKSFGIEIECASFINPDDLVENVRMNTGIDIRNEYNDYNHITRTWWKIVPDGSIGSSSGGQYWKTEIVSPILKNAAGFKQLENICNVIQSYGNRIQVNSSTGIHVHVNVTRKRFKESKKSGIPIKRLIVNEVLNVLFFYARYENAIDFLHPQSRRNASYSKHVFDTANRIFCNTVDTWNYFTNVKSIHDSYSGYDSRKRYFSVNIESYMKYGTIEFRQHAGSTDAEKLSRWIEFLQAIIKCSYEKYTLQSKLVDIYHPFNGCNGNAIEYVKSLFEELKPYLKPSTIRYYRKRYNQFAETENRPKW